MILNHLNGSSIIIRIMIGRRQEGQGERRYKNGSKDESSAWPQAKEYGGLWKLAKARQGSSCRAFRRNAELLTP